MDCYRYVPLSNAKNTSFWKYFGFKPNDGRTLVSEYNNKVYCIIIGCKYAEIAYSGNTTNMSHHLSQYHPVDNASYVGVCASNPQLPITSYVVKRMFLIDSKAKEISATIVDCIVEDLRPMALIEGKGFVKLMETVAPNYPLAIAGYFYTESEKLLQTTKWLVLTSDISTSHHAYLSLAVHFIGHSNILRMYLLNCIELAADQPTANDIAETIKQKLHFWGYLKISDDGIV
ncbi:Zinc finger BED domain-containing protein 1 [Thelohanellus kitauei]|uniref:Zinc finger BED domain-containing protein 1 n=1 Tax=Thelohanellus kitauei TaxID=669202 RepID=A0A0C2MN62_THEKT|nr:Zinc finger BED domain-containing protein 1 [Thelohanellus kitauei]